MLVLGTLAVESVLLVKADVKQLLWGVEAFYHRTHHEGSF